MEETHTNAVDEESSMSPETPEDVAVLYTWANVHGGKYRDFSASRREYRAQQRHRIVEAQRQAELEAARALEEAAARELEEARVEEAAARAESDYSERRTEAEEARRLAEEHVERERLAAQRHVETAEELKLALEQAQREMEEARHRAEEQAARYAEADKRWRESQKERTFVPGVIEDPYYFAGPLEPTAFAPGKGVRSSVPQRVSSESRITASYYRARESQMAQSGESHVAPRRIGTGNDVYGLRDNNGERPSWTPHHIEQRIETPEDTLERHRVDEQQRRDASTGSRYNEVTNDSYFDRMPLLGEPRNAEGVSTRNSAQSDLHIPPRVQQTRTGHDSGSRAAAAPPALPLTEDLISGAQSLESRRRRESATDLSTRTERRPRSSEPAYLSESGRSESGERGDFLAGDNLRQDGRYYQASERERYPTTPRDASPEWLLRNRPAEDAARERLRADAREIALAAQQRLDEQQRKLDEERRAIEQARAEEERRIAEEDRLAVEEKVRAEERYRAGEERLRVEQERHRDEERHKLDDERYQKEQERLRGEEKRRADDAAQERSLRDSQIVPAADGSVNLRPLPDRPLLSSLPPMRERSQASSLSPLAGRDSRVAAKQGPGGDPLPPAPVQVERRRVPRETRPSVPVTATGAAGMPSVRTAEPAKFAVTPVPPPSVEGAAPLSAQRPGATAPADTLQQSRERVAARWFALKDLMNAGPEQRQEQPPAAARSKNLPTPCLSIVALSGGVGKTSMVATVGRALSSVGEKVLLADTTAHGLLPYYFGARELRPDVVRTFSPPPGSPDAPVYMVNYETDRLTGDETKQQAMVEEMMRQARPAGRILLDLNGSSAWLARLLTRLHSNILVPIAPDMNSVLSIQSVDRFFSGCTDSEGRPVAPYYVLNQFDASLPLHLDVREVLRQQLGNRLLPIMIRRSPAVSEALAEGMTVIDYAPDSQVAEDYKNLAEWVRKLAPPATTGLRGSRWSEQ